MCKTPANERTAARYRWLVLYCRPRFEFKLRDALFLEGIELFFPTRTEIRQWSDRKKRIVAPLFPGYIFVHVDERKRVIALEKNGALKYVGFGGKLAEIPEDIIADLRIATSKPELVAVEHGALQPGERIRVMDGIFAGMAGTLIEHRGASRIAIHIEAIAQSVVIEVPLASIEKL